MDWNAASTWGLAARLGAVALLALVTVAAAWRWAQRKHAHGEAEESVLPYDSAMDAVTLPPRTRV